MHLPVRDRKHRHDQWAGHQCQVSNHSPAPTCRAVDTHVPGKPYVSDKNIDAITKMKGSGGFISEMVDRDR